MISRRSVLRALLRFVLGAFALVGIWRTISLSLHVSRLQTEIQRLTRLTGYLEIKDPKKVYVVSIPSDQERTWQFRIYFPANYDARLIAYNGRISATTMRHRNISGTSSGSGQNSEPVEFLSIVAFFHDRTGWTLHTSSHNSRSVTGVSNELGKLVEKPLSLIVEIAGQDGPQEFEVDTPICLLRLRTAEPVADKDSADPLYEGFFHYIVPAAAMDRWNAAQAGKGS